MVTVTAATAAMSHREAAPEAAAAPARPRTANKAHTERHRSAADQRAAEAMRRGRSILLGALLLAVLCPTGVSAQGESTGRSGNRNCDPAKDRIWRIAETETRHRPDSLRVLLDLAAFVHDCEREVSEDDTLSLNLELWLLNNETFALDGLGDYDAARAHVERFFADFFDEAPDRYRARFYLWRLHLRALDGTPLASITDYAEAQQYAHALDSTTRAGLYLDGAYAYFGVHEHEAGLRLIDKARRFLGSYGTSEARSHEARLAATRALLLEGEARLRMGEAPDRVETQLQEAAERYSALGLPARTAIAWTLLGMAYAARGDTAGALAQMDSAAALARRSGNARSRSYALYRQGRLLRQAGAFDVAEQALLEALEAAETVQEFSLSAAYELARLYEAERELRQAEQFYLRVREAAQPTGLAASLESVRKAHEAEIRLLLIRSARRQNRLWFGLASALVVLGFLVARLVFVRRRRQTAPPSEAETEPALAVPAVPEPEPALPEKDGEGVFIPARKPTGLSLQELEARFQEAVESELLGVRLACIYAVLFDPDLVLGYIDDDYLRPQVEAGRIENSTALFRCAGAAEAAGGRPFKGDPANTLGTYLREEIKKRGWDWPKNPPEWKQHFIEHHSDILP